MGTVSVDDRLPLWMVSMGVVLILAMTCAMVSSILHDIAQMRAMWRTARVPGRKRKDMPAEGLTQRKCLRRRKKPPHGVSLMETDLRASMPEGVE